MKLSPQPAPCMRWGASAAPTSRCVRLVLPAAAMHDRGSVPFLLMLYVLVSVVYLSGHMHSRVPAYLPQHDSSEAAMHPGR
jgi:hypothetical protein